MKTALKKPEKTASIKKKAVLQKAGKTAQKAAKTASSKQNRTGTNEGKKVVSTKLKKKLPRNVKGTEKKKAEKKPLKYLVLYDKKSGEWILDKNHKYFHQIQAQLYFAKREVGLFFIWTINSCALFEIKRDPEWVRNVDILLLFYFEKLLPHIVSNPAADIVALQETARNFELEAQESNFLDDDE